MISFVDAPARSYHYQVFTLISEGQSNKLLPGFAVRVRALGISYILFRHVSFSD